MPVKVGSSHGLRLGGTITIRNYNAKTQDFNSRREVTDGGVGDADRKRNGQIVYNGARNLRSYVQVKDPKAGYNEGNRFWHFTQNAKAIQVSSRPAAVLKLGPNHGLKTGARVYLQSADGKINGRVHVDNKLGDLVKGANPVKFSTLVDKGWSGRVLLVNKDGTRLAWRVKPSSGNIIALERTNVVADTKDLAKRKNFMMGALNAMSGAINGVARSSNTAAFNAASQSFRRVFDGTVKNIGPSWNRDPQLLSMLEQYDKLKLVRNGYGSTLRHVQLINDISAAYKDRANNSIIAKFGNISTDFRGMSSLRILSSMENDIRKTFTGLELVLKSEQTLLNSIFKAREAGVPEIAIAKALKVGNWNDLDKGLTNVNGALSKFSADARRWMSEQADNIWSGLENNYLPVKRSEADAIARQEQQDRWNLIFSIVTMGTSLVGMLGGATSLAGSIATYGIRKNTVDKTNGLLTGSRNDRNFLGSNEPTAGTSQHVQWLNRVDQKDREISKNELDLGNYKKLAQIEQVKIAGWSGQFADIAGALAVDSRNIDLLNKKMKLAKTKAGMSAAQYNTGSFRLMKSGEGMKFGRAMQALLSFSRQAAEPPKYKKGDIEKNIGPSIATGPLTIEERARLRKVYDDMFVKYLKSIVVSKNSFKTSGASDIARYAGKYYVETGGRSTALGGTAPRPARASLDIYTEKSNVLLDYYTELFR